MIEGVLGGGSFTGPHAKGTIGSFFIIINLQESNRPLQFIGAE